ncbi:MAG: hypothetical protein NXI15_03060 [Gammaproteobacteria bacterium]|jgi:hypothetical protein|nr:hypothetical protein [Gammaproteobacteria bacterium]
MTLNWALLVLCTLLAVEGFFRLPLGVQVAQLQLLLKKITHTLSSPKISDHWKEKVLPNYAGQLFLFSIKLFLIVMLAISPFLVLGIIADIAGLEFMRFLASWSAIGASTLLAIAYVFVRRRMRAGSNR